MLLYNVLYSYKLYYLKILNLIFWVIYLYKIFKYIVIRFKECYIINEIKYILKKFFISIYLSLLRYNDY